MVISGNFGEDGGGAADGVEAVAFVFADDGGGAGEGFFDVGAEAVFEDVGGVDVAGVGAESVDDLGEGVDFDFVEGLMLSEAVNVGGRDDDVFYLRGEALDLDGEFFAALGGELFGVADADFFKGVVGGDSESGNDEGAEEGAASGFIEACDHGGVVLGAAVDRGCGRRNENSFMVLPV